MDRVRIERRSPLGWPSPAVTIGNFDGVHVGHRALVAAAIARARASGGTSVVLTYHRDVVRQASILRFYKPLMMRVLASRGFCDADAIRQFCEPKLTELHDPGLMPNIDAAAARIVGIWSAATVWRSVNCSRFAREYPRRSQATSLTSRKRPSGSLPPLRPVRPVRDPAPLLARTLTEWGGRGDLWVFGYASLIWRPDFAVEERRPARVHGWHRALKMWSRVNRGTPDNPGLVFGLLSGGSCRGVVLRVAQAQGEAVLLQLWEREMPTGVYDPRWLRCETPHGPVAALAFTLSRRSPNFTGTLSPAQYRHIFAHAHGRYGSTHDYAHQTYESLSSHGIHDRALEQLLAHARAPRRT